MRFIKAIWALRTAEGLLRSQEFAKSPCLQRFGRGEAAVAAIPGGVRRATRC